MTHIIVFIVFIHTSITLILRNDLTSVLDNDLMGLKGAIASDAITSICSLYHFDSNSVLATSSPAFLQVRKRTVGAMFAARGAVCIVTFVEHNPILTIVVTSDLRSTDAF